jgi:hypothetical protein
MKFTWHLENTPFCELFKDISIVYRNCPSVLKIKQDVNNPRLNVVDTTLESSLCRMGKKFPFPLNTKSLFIKRKN